MRLYVLFPLLLLIVLLTGCWDKIEVNDMAMIVSAGIDHIEDDQIELTVQVFIPNPTATSDGGGNGGAGGEGNVYTFSTKGSSMPEALTDLQKRLPRYFTWSHTKAYVFGETLARRGMNDEFDFLFRDIQPREQANFFICKGTAKKLLNSQIDPNTYETLIKLSQKPTTRSSTMHEVEALINGESGAFLLPTADLTIMLTNGVEKKILSVSGLAVIHNKRLVGYLDNECTTGLRLLQHAVLGRNITLARKEEAGSIVIRVLHSEMKLYPSIDNGKWKMRVNVKLDADVIQNSTKLVLANGSDNLRKIEGAFNDEIKQTIGYTMEQLQHKLKTDVVGFARAYHKKYPQEWKKVKAEWTPVFQSVDVEIETKTRIHLPGITNIRVAQ